MDERILIVEDEAIVLLDIRSRLAGLGYKVVGTASTGEEAIAKANATMPDAILMDIGLKGDIDGISAAASIRKTQDTPIIYLTANSDITTLQRAKITGPFGYVLKPFDERELRVTIEMALYKHRMDRDLYDARQWLNVTLKSIGDSVITSDEAGVVRFMNSAAEALTGWELKDAAGKDIGTIFRIENGGEPRFPQSATAEAKSGLAGSGTATLVNREGRRIPIEYKLVPIDDDWGKIIGTVSIFKDITDKLQAAEEQIRSALELLPDAVVTCDLKGSITCGNNAAASIFGLDPEALQGKDLFNIGIFSWTEAQKVSLLFRKALEMNSPVSEEVALISKDGSTSAKTIKAIPMKSGPEPVFMVALKSISRP